MTQVAMRISADETGQAGEGEELFTAPARWSVAPVSGVTSTGLRGPRHQTLRRKGIAPVYPKPADLADGERGALVITRDGITLRPYRPRSETVVINAEEMRLRVFYRNAAEILRDGERIVIGLSDQDAEVIDVLAQAYL